ncbi:hypothetical protein O181_009412 [Austropuccinia psidii MF-1]|uniref:Uncharacterized protein n=1 Tax=Austropuccinia psidii MF-1 TaxID=1389203 RepID=A0A9Q3BRQ5_9BASI|nr:hypothetical protein [Austropuccinia psidii MF-1]
MLRWQIAIQEYRGNITIIYKEGEGHTNAYCLSRWPLDNVKSNPSYDPEVASKIPIHFMEIDRRKNFKFFEWAPEHHTLDSGNTDSEGTEASILGITPKNYTINSSMQLLTHIPNTNSVANCCNSFNKSAGAQNWNTS